MMIIGTSLESSKQALELARRYSEPRSRAEAPLALEDLADKGCGTAT